MKAVVWHATQDVRVEEVPDPKIEEPTDAIVRITSAAICGSDLHLYDVLGPFLDQGDILGHEPMGVVEEVGPQAATHVRPGDRVVIPFNISCGHCWMCERQRYAQCETTQNREYRTGASLFGYTKLYGQVPGGQAEFLRVPMAQFGPIKVPNGPPDERYLYLSDILPTAWQAVEYAEIPPGGSVTVFGLGPVGQFCTRIAKHHGARVIGVDYVPERREMARRNGIEVLDPGGGRIADMLYSSNAGELPMSITLSGENRFQRAASVNQFAVDAYGAAFAAAGVDDQGNPVDFFQVQGMSFRGDGPESWVVGNGNDRGRVLQRHARFCREGRAAPRVVGGRGRWSG